MDNTESVMNFTAYAFYACIVTLYSYIYILLLNTDKN